MNTRKADILLGIVFFGALLALGVVTIVLSDFALGVPTHQVELLSDDVGFLQPGDPVLLHGMSAGQVERIERLVEPVTGTAPTEIGVPPHEVPYTVRIVTILDVDPYLFLREDYRVFIEERGLLGGKLIRIETGDSSRPVAREQPLKAVASQSMIQAAGSILQDNRDNLARTIENLATLSDDVSAGKGTVGLLLRDPELVASVRAIVSDVQTLGRRLVAGSGTLGRLFTDEQVYEDVRAFVSDVRSVFERVKRGEGSAGKFFQDDRLYADAASFVAELDGAAKDLRAGRGTAGRLLVDEALAEDLARTATNLRRISDDARAGRGTVGRLLTDESLYDNAATFFGTDLQDAVDRLANLLDEVTEGEGLLGTLIHDRELAANFKDIVGQVLGAVEDARETSPVQSLGSFLFGTF